MRGRARTRMPLAHVCLIGFPRPQMLVDLFVNYDCDLKAPNLYERTVQVCTDARLHGCKDARVYRCTVRAALHAATRSLRHAAADNHAGHAVNTLNQR
jgi:hypothetical protein